MKSPPPDAWLGPEWSPDVRKLPLVELKEPDRFASSGRSVPLVYLILNHGNKAAQPSGILWRALKYKRRGIVLWSPPH